MLIRPRAWWFNKIPISVMFVALLGDGRPAGVAFWMALALVLVAVCAAANYGYALNELFDVEEDARIGRENAAARLGATRVWIAAIFSAIACVAAAWAGAGAIGATLAVLELCLPLAYSVPPIRIKERRWMGVASDALAAHVFPAALALLVCARLGVTAPDAFAIAASLVWALAAGLRGILSHQLHTAEQDRRGGLRTVVEDAGAQRLEALIVRVLIPLECAGLLAVIAWCRPGPVLWCGLVLYASVEAFKMLDGRFVVASLRPSGQRYVPMLQENFYKIWGPVVIAVDAARVDPRFLILAAIYIAPFWIHARIEAGRLREVVAALRYPAHGT